MRAAYTVCGLGMGKACGAWTTALPTASRWSSVDSPAGPAVPHPPSGFICFATAQRHPTGGAKPRPTSVKTLVLARPPYGGRGHTAVPRCSDVRGCSPLVRGSSVSPLRCPGERIPILGLPLRNGIGLHAAGGRVGGLRAAKQDACIASSDAGPSLPVYGLACSGHDKSRSGR